MLFGHMVWQTGTSKISGRTSIDFHPMSGGQVKNSANTDTDRNNTFIYYPFTKKITTKDLH